MYERSAISDVVYGDYVWDADKDSINRRKHKLAFINAAELFDRPHCVFPARGGNGERRWKALGLVCGFEAAVIFTERDGKKRIISARRAKRRERKIFHASLADAYDG